MPPSVRFCALSLLITDRSPPYFEHEEIAGWLDACKHRVGCRMHEHSLPPGRRGHGAWNRASLRRTPSAARTNSRSKGHWLGPVLHHREPNWHARVHNFHPTGRDILGSGDARPLLLGDDSGRLQRIACTRSVRRGAFRSRPQRRHRHPHQVAPSLESPSHAAAGALRGSWSMLHHGRESPESGPYAGWRLAERPRCERRLR